ncbi:type III-A CRISPR-associated RAMP protein Csm5 [candidate division KSB1 bacterium]|nr:MAG: type III-A CRISPR-associated RAMP protein Csm5 [candidate division KSB1 bacterium]
MKVYKFIGRTLSPVNIGSGEEIEPFDYIINNGYFYRISLEKVITDFSEEDRNKFYNIVDSGNINNLRKFISNRIDIDRHSVFSCEVSESVEKLYRRKFDDIQNQLLITPFIRNKLNFLPFIPGSSIKGSIRTAVISELGKTIDRNYIFRDPKWERNIEGKILGNIDRGRPDAKKDPFRAVKIRDIALPDDSTIITQVKNMAKNKRNGRISFRSIQLMYEVLKSKLYGGEIEFNGEIIIDNNLQSKGKRAVSKEVTIDMIRNFCNSFYKDKLEMEHKKFYRSSMIDSNSRKLMEEQISSDSFILRLGRFSGVESVTLDNYRNPRPPGRRGWGNSRNICEERYPMGWIKITLT